MQMQYSTTYKKTLTLKNRNKKKLKGKGEKLKTDKFRLPQFVFLTSILLTCCIFQVSSRFSKIIKRKMMSDFV